MNNRIEQIVSKVNSKNVGILTVSISAGLITALAYKANLGGKIQKKAMETILAVHAKIIRSKMDVTVHLNPSNEEIVAIVGENAVLYHAPVTIKNMTAEEADEMVSDNSWLESVIEDNGINQVYRMVTEDGQNTVVVIAKMK